MPKSNELKGFKVFIIEYFDGREEHYELIENLGGEIIWGRSFADPQNVYTEKELIDQCHDVDAVMVVSRDTWSKAILEAAPKLQIISRQGIGLDKIPLEAATELGILVTNTAKTIVETVAEHTFCLILAFMRKLPQSLAAAQQCRWRVPELRFKQLRYKTIGLIGFGNIARAVAQRFAGWECELIAYDPYVDASVMEQLGVKKAELDELLRTSDIVSLHMPLLDSTKEIINKRAFSLMKPGVLLINTSRGKLVDESALVEALKDGHVTGAGLDVLGQEPIKPNNPLLGFENVYITPHNAGTAEESITLTVKQGVKNCVDALMGKIPEFLVNPQALKRRRGV